MMVNNVKKLQTYKMALCYHTEAYILKVSCEFPVFIIFLNDGMTDDYGHIKRIAAGAKCAFHIRFNYTCSNNAIVRQQLNLRL